MAKRISQETCFIANICPVCTNYKPSHPQCTEDYPVHRMRDGYRVSLKYFQARRLGTTTRFTTAGDDDGWNFVEYQDADGNWLVLHSSDWYWRK